VKILNLYAGIGGNRKLWGDTHDITAIELNPQIAKIYQDFFPKDKVIVADAHQYLLEHFKEFEFIWSSPPCPSHSRSRTSLAGWSVYLYPDMKLYEEIIFLKHFSKKLWVVENVKPYYEPLVNSTAEIDRHLFWCNFRIHSFPVDRNYDVSRATKEVLSQHHGIIFPAGTQDQRKLLRNVVYPPLGLHILNESQRNIQAELFNQGGHK
jgi:DNA (cytosine-5)-methyltransferase 1